MTDLTTPDILVRLAEYGNRERTSWEAAAMCVAAHAEITRLRESRAVILHLVQFHPKYGTAEWCGKCLPSGAESCECSK